MVDLLKTTQLLEVSNSTQRRCRIRPMRFIRSKGPVKVSRYPQLKQHVGGSMFWLRSTLNFSGEHCGGTQGVSHLSSLLSTTLWVIRLDEE
ncbi:hypothetical protein TNCV_5104831 [Trichonephila clavipes]|nr:hypothetical protein TNCV_5104831 [Trichonephila clavipes]